MSILLCNKKPGEPVHDNPNDPLFEGLAAPVLKSPVDNSNVKLSKLKFEWDKVNQQDRTYAFQIARHDSINGKKYDIDKTISSPTTEYVPTEEEQALFKTTLYYWRVRVLEPAGKWAKFSRFLIVSDTVAAPILSPPPGEYTEVQTVSVTCATEGAIIRFTVDGTEPNENSQQYTNPILITTTTTLYVQAFKDGWTPSEIAGGQYKITGKVEQPVLNPPPGVYQKPQDVYASCATEDAIIHYTRENRPPTEADPVYSELLQIRSTGYLFVKAFKEGWEASEMAGGLYTITGTVATPELNPLPGRYTEPKTVTITCATEGAIIFYTREDKEPTQNDNVYSAPIQITETSVLYARAFKEGWEASEKTGGTYEITGRVAAPVLSPPPGTYTSAQTVSISCATQDAIIRYTVDGFEPTEQSQIYDNPIIISLNTTLKVKAFKEGWEPSLATGGTYTITGKVEKPLQTPAPGIFNLPQNVVMNCITPGAVIRYTLDGTDPSETSQQYIEPIYINNTTVLLSRAFKTDWEPSDIAGGKYEIVKRVATPLLIPSPGTYDSAQNVIITCATDDAVIHFTRENREATISDSVYTQPIKINSTGNLFVKAFKPGWEPSESAGGPYIINKKVATPELNPKPGPFQKAQDVHVSCATEGATIRYTFDERPPNETDPIYAAPIHISTTTFLFVKAFKEGWESSDPNGGKYTISGIVAKPELDPPPSIFTSPTSVTISCETPDAVIHYTFDDREPTENDKVYENPIDIDSTMSLYAKGFKTDWTPSERAGGQYIITGKVAKPNLDPPPGTYTSPRSVTITCETPEAKIYYTTDGFEPTPQSQLYGGPVQINTSTTFLVKAFKEGWDPSDTEGGDYTITGNVAKPAFDPGPGNYPSAQNVTITCATEGATIYYTLDGSIPTEENDQYVAPILIEETVTLSAKAFKQDWESSDVNQGEYIIDSSK